MTEFPAIAEGYYALRDDRTNHCVSVRDYQTSSCIVTIDRVLLETFAGQVMLITSCNLLSRWCRSVQVVLPQVTAHPDLVLASTDLAGAILAQMYDADPFGQFEITSHARGDSDLQLHIGTIFSPQARHPVNINASGWHAALSSKDPISLQNDRDINSGNCIGALAAACLGISQVFKHAINYPYPELLTEGVFDFFQIARVRDERNIQVYPFLPGANVGKLLMVGAGSVGSAAAFCLRTLRAVCDLTIVDNDLVKVENFNRSPIFGKSCYGLNKAVAVEASLAGSNITAHSFTGWWEDFIKARGSEAHSFDAWLPLANEHGVRWSMQNNFPPLMIHASTTANWGVNHGRHIPCKDDCLADRFPSTVAKESLECSTATIQTAEDPIDAALPFLSVLGGVLIAAELMRLQIDGYPQTPNFALLDLGRSCDHIQAWDKRPRPGCVCRGQSAGLHKTINGNTKYINLSF